jgi:hypothetical protein
VGTVLIKPQENICALCRIRKNQDFQKKTKQKKKQKKKNKNIWKIFYSRG